MHSPTARDATEGLAECPQHRAEFDAECRRFGWTPLQRVATILRSAALMAPEHGSYGKLMAICANEVARAEALRSAGTEGGETQGAVEMREACLRLCNSALYGAPSTWPGAFPHGWKPPLSWDPGRAPTPEEAALHDNGVTDAWIAILTGTRDEQGNPRALPTAELLTGGHVRDKDFR